MPRDPCVWLRSGLVELLKFQGPLTLGLNETQAKSTVKENFIGYLPLQLNYNFWTVLCIVDSFFSLPEQEKMLPKSKIGRTS